MTLGKRVKKARLLSGLSQDGLALAIGNWGDGRTITRTAIAQWESGATKEVEAANLLKAAKILNVSPEWLQFGTSTMRPEQVPLQNGNGIKSVPILSNEQATNFMEYGNADIFIGMDPDLATVTGPNVFALVVKGERMAPTLMPGDLVVIDPDIKPLPGEIILVEWKAKNIALLGRYRPLESQGFRTPIFEIVPRNQYWPTMKISNENQGRIIGTLVEHRCRRRMPRMEIFEDPIFK